MKLPVSLALLSLAAVLVLGGCASTDSKTAGNDPNAAPTDSSGQKVSEIPWNRPASWEGGGALGSMMNQ